MRRFCLPALVLGSMLAVGCSDSPTAVAAPETAAFSFLDTGADRNGNFLVCAKEVGGPGNSQSVLFIDDQAGTCPEGFTLRRLGRVVDIIE